MVISKMNRKVWILSVSMLTLAAIIMTGCKSPDRHRESIDAVGSAIITEKQHEALGREYDFNIEKPSDAFRELLLSGQNLPYSARAALGSANLERIEHWPEDDYPFGQTNEEAASDIAPDETIVISLVDALQIGAANSRDYQRQKEEVFRSALSLELQRNNFRNIFRGQVENITRTDGSGDTRTTGTATSGDFSVRRKLTSGVELTTALAVDLAHLFTSGGATARGVQTDASISIPLLRGAGRHIVAEPLTQAERDVIYAIWDFEHFKKEYAVNVANRYLSVLQQLDEIHNREADYRSRATSARRVRRLADFGRVDEIQVDQAMQDELRARQQWISAKQRYQSSLDDLKQFLGLPPDALIELDPDELERLAAPAMDMLEQLDEIEASVRDDQESVPADAPIELDPPDMERAGPYELPESRALDLAFENRLDLRTSEGAVYDAQRAVIIAADDLRGELTLLGSANIGQGRSIGERDDATFRPREGRYSSLLTLDLPLERTQEQIAYRNSYIALERAVRSLQQAEDGIKSSIRNALRDMLEARENIEIQARAVQIAEKRVDSVSMFLDAGRAEMRDLLDAQDALVNAQNALSRAVVTYRISELGIQRDMGVLEIDEKGLWQEYQPGDDENV